MLPSFIFSQSRVLTSKKVSTGPIIDGVVDQVWTYATETIVQLGQTYDVHNPASIMDCAGCHSYNSTYTVKLKSVYTANRIYFLVNWTDSTASFTRGAWSFATGSWSVPSGQSEDRISFHFPRGRIKGVPYNTAGGGCMTKCHTYWPTSLDPHVSNNGIVDDAWLDSGRADLWHSKAGRGGAFLSATGTNLVIDPISHQVTSGTFSMIGTCDDQYHDVWADSTINGEDGGRYGDAGTSAYANNKIGSRPKYMEKNPVDFADAMFLKQSEITAGECVGSETTGVSDSLAAIYWPLYVALKAVVPERILRTPAGSRGDIDFGAVWSSNSHTWTAELSRALQTGYNDDVQFSDNQFYLFGVAAFENSRHGYEHRTSRTDTLKFDTVLAIGIKNLNTGVPKEYVLYQSYPNPFNPSTKISFDIPKFTFVNVSIFDLSGKVVKVLVNENLNSGTYETEFEGTNFSSGVYFYRIVAGDFIESKKMILVR
jgi:hypothetical protein